MNFSTITISFAKAIAVGRRTSMRANPKARPSKMPMMVATEFIATASKNRPTKRNKRYRARFTLSER